MKKVIFLIIIFITAKSQHIGISLTPSFFIKENILSLSFHSHITYPVIKELELGFAYERILLNPIHNTFGIVASKHISNFAITLSPGITFEHKEPKPFPSLHIELNYYFSIKNILIGPVLEFAYDPNDYHIGIGLHSELHILKTCED